MTSIIGKCIYCGLSEGNLSKEHIIPFALNGEKVLYKASCKACRDITSSFESEVLEKDWKFQRAAMGFKTRHKKRRPKKFPLEVEKWDSSPEIIQVSADDYWPEMLLPIFKLPAHIDERRYDTGIELVSVVPVGTRKPSENIRNYGVKKFWSSYGLLPPRHIAYARLFAKIAYGAMVEKYGLENLKEVYVVSAILGISNDIGKWVGCDGQVMIPKDKDVIYAVYDSIVNGEIHVRVKLFAFCDVPEYLVIVGRLKNEVNSA